MSSPPLSQPTTQEAQAARRTKRGIAATIIAASSLPVMGGAIIAPALPSIRDHFADVAGAETLVRLVLTTPGLAVALSAPFAGNIIERIGRRETLILGLLLYALAGTTGLYLEALPLLLLSRVLLGVSMALVMTCATTLVADHYIGPARARFMAMQSSSMAFGGVIFLITGGVLADMHWRAPFGVYGVSLFVAVLAALTLATKKMTPVNLNNQGPSDAKYPYRTVIAAAVAAMMTMSLFYLIPVQVPFIVKERLGADATHAGMAVAASTLISGLSSMFAPRVIARVGNAGALLVTFTLVGIGLAIIGLAESWVPLCSGLGLVGLGGGQLMPNVNSWVSQLAPPARRPVLLGRTTAAIFLGQFISPLIASPFIAAGLGQRGVFLGGAGLALVLLIIYAALRSTLEADTRAAA